jgi:hypothetical protein
MNEELVKVFSHNCIPFRKNLENELNEHLNITHIISQEKEYTYDNFKNVYDKNKEEFKFMMCKIELSDDYKIFIHKWQNNAVIGSVLKDNEELFVFKVVVKNNCFQSNIQIDGDCRKINKDMIYYDITDKIYYKNIDYEMVSDKMSDILNNRIIRTAAKYTGDDKTIKIKNYIDSLINKYVIDIEYGGGRADEVPIIFSIKNKDDDIRKYSHTKTEVYDFFDKLIFLKK